MNAGLPLVGVVAAGLAALIMVELWPAPAADPVVPARAGAAPAALGPAPESGSAPMDTLLGRPLFSQSRRPPDVAAGVVTGEASLPRMTAILIDGPRRSVLFAPSGGGKPISVGEGGRLGAFTIQSIEPQHVVVLGPDGRRTVRTSFDPALPPPSPPPPLAAPTFPGISVPLIPPAAPGAGPGAAR